jgi:Right handed beta helix region
VQGAAGAGAGGLYVTGSADHDTVLQNEVSGNHGSGIFSEEESDHIVIDRNRIHGNCCDSTRQTHGIYIQGDDQQVTNNLIYAESNGFGVHAYDYGRRLRIVSNTIDGATLGPIVIGGSGSGPEGTGVADVDVVNNIGTGSPAGYGVFCYENPTNYRIHDNLFFGVQLLSNCTLGAGNALANPLYVGGGDYHLRTGSPGIDSGDGAWLYAPDFGGGARPQGVRVDKGAYEG